MMTATFRDGTECRIEPAPGVGFEPREGERFLFEFPEGTLKEGVIHFERASSKHCAERPRHVLFDAKTRIVAVEVA